MVGHIRHVSIVQAQIVGVYLKPGEMLALKIGSPKERLVVLCIETHTVSEDRFHEKGSESPGLVLADLPVKTIEGINGVAEGVSSDQPSFSDVHGHASEMEIGP